MLSNDFVSYDDYLLITNNLLVQEFSWQTISGAFGSYDPELYVPLTILSYQIERAIFGFSPVAFHATNLLLHLASIGLVIGILHKLAQRSFENATAIWIALIGGVLFALHPQHTESVVSASARKDILSSCLALLSIWFYLKAEGRRNTLFLLSIGSFLLAILSKVSVIMLPVAILLIDLYEQRSFTWKTQLKEKAPYLALSLLFGIIALYGKRTEILMLSPGEHMLLALRGISLYITHLLFPVGFSVFYPAGSAPYTLYDLHFLLPCALVVCAGILLWLRRSNRVAWFGISFFLLMQLPSLAAFSKNGFVYYASDRYAYLPDVGLIFIIAMCIVLAARPLQEKGMRLIIAGLILLLGTLSWQQSQVWKDSETLYRHILRSHPTSVHALNNLGSTLFEEGRNDEALEVYEFGIAQGLFVPELYTNIGKLLYQMGEQEVAIEWFTKATQNKPEHRGYIEEDFTPYYLLGQIYEGRGEMNRTFELFYEAASLGNAFFTPHYNLGIMEQKYGRIPEANDALSKAIDRNPKHLDARYRLAAVSAELGDFETAIGNLEYILKRDPDYENAKRHLQKLRQFAVPNR